MRLPRDVEPQRFIHALSALGYKPTRQVGFHIRVTTILNGEHHEVIPKHSPIKIGTLSSNLTNVAKHHGLSVQEVLIKLKL